MYGSVIEGSRQPRPILPLAIPLLAALVAAPAQASLMLPMSLEELSQDAELVVEGRVVRSEAQRSSGGGRILTVVTIEVGEAWKGAPVEEVELRLPGGTLDGITQRVMGVPSFEVGEEAVVFLRRVSAKQVEGAAADGVGSPGEDALAAPLALEGSPRLLQRVSGQLVGMAQGKLEIGLDPAGERVAAADLSGLELYDPAKDRLVESPLSTPERISTLKARVQAAGR